MRGSREAGEGECSFQHRRPARGSSDRDVGQPELIARLVIPRPSPNLSEVVASYIAGIKRWTQLATIASLTGSGTAPAVGGPVVGVLRARLEGPVFTI